MQTLFLDIRYGVRLLTKSPGFSLAIALVLALGIGATSSMFSIVRSVLLRPLPFPDPDRVVMLWAPQRFIERAPLSGPDFHDWKERSKSFAHVAAFDNASFNLAIGNEAQRVGGSYVTSELFDVLGIKPRLGRGFDTVEDPPGAHVAILSDHLWRRAFAKDPSIVGSTISLDGEPYSVIGILPDGQRGLYGTGELWVPIRKESATTESSSAERGNHHLHVIGRLGAGVTREAAEAELIGIAKELERAFPNSNRNVTARVIPFHEQVVGKLRPKLLLLFGAIGFVLLIVCANVANLLLARSSARRMELALRVALGATRTRILRQLLTESLVLALVGGALGVLASLWGIDLLVGFLSNVLPSSVDVGLDMGGVLFALGISLFVGVLFGILPAVGASRPDVVVELKEGATRATAGAGRSKLRSGLVISEVALAFLLCAGAGLLLKGFVKLSGQDPGFDPAHLSTAQVHLSGAKYKCPGDIECGPEADRATVQFEREVESKLLASPGVASVGAIDSLPMSGNNSNGDFEIEGHAKWPDGEAPLLERRRTSAGYFHAMGIAIRLGRAFTNADDKSSAPVIIVNETMANRFFPGENPVGRRIRWDTNQDAWREIVGVVADVRSNGLGGEVVAESYVPFAQWQAAQISFVLRTEGNANGPKLLTDAVKAVDSMQPTFGVETMDDILADDLASARINVVLIGAFAAVALVLAGIGIFGVVSYQTSQRTREIGIRVALGATAHGVIRMVVRQSMTVVALGLAVGVGLAALSGRVLTGFLYGVSAFDPAVYAALAAAIASVALSASYLPARRAAAINPASALRTE